METASILTAELLNKYNKAKRCIYLNLTTKKQLETNGPFSSYVRDIESENSEIERLKCYQKHPKTDSKMCFS